MPKTLVICCDGTWNTPDQKGAPTNVTKMVRAVLTRSRNGDPQTVYYDKGVGTGNGLDRFLGGTIGLGLGSNVQEAYSFLAVNYEPGDRIVMFGFSRGAYTVRSLAGMVNLAGVLHKGDLDRLEDVWNYYRTKPDERHPDALKDIVRLADRQPGVDLLGVWDTVGSLGIPGNLLGRVGRRRYEFHDVTLGRKTRRAYQALAIDERRRNFLPAIWDSSEIGPDQDVDQVWFAGAHSNIGGGYPDPVLSDQAFLWMVDKAKPLLDFDEDYLERRVRKLREENAEGALIDSIKGVWKLLGRTLRPIGQDRTEGVHPSALVRLRTSGTYAKHEQPFEPYPYKPANLLAYLKLRGIGL
ncbi:DUF2235 domain-containing protein [Sphingomonas sp. Leaf62]|uniref:DUF2235 domain-containing protein n=1 Tax=Sphingomonas sp. Leaf62 TaxID=1736228 RepID=UPI0006F8F253|nr:DUF2235 domain-containing protein [Sphingomonas sp. Leaf62]KQN74689.1 hypothetical protein ASE91_17200 [Sphingomonas sp. Leaf62]